MDKLILIRKEFDPDLVFLPCSQDIHQDHHVIYQEGIRAFKYSSIFGYELPQNTFAFNHVGFIGLNNNIIKRKISAMLNYESQKFRDYSSENFIRSLAIIRGLQCGKEYAEAFEVIRLII